MKYIDFFRKVRIKVNAYRVSPREKCVLITDQTKPEDLVFQIKNSKSLNIQIVGCIGRHIKTSKKKTHEGVHYYDHLTHLPKLVYKKNPSMIVICFAKPNSSALKNLIEICQEKGLRIKKLCKEERQGEQGSHLRLRPIEPEELLGRASISLDTFSIGNMVKNKVILITGAGGSIGSEIARQISKYQPKLFIFFEITELFLYNLELEFQTDFPEIHFVSILGSIQDEKRVEWIVKNYKPDVIFHAAAYKHVPMMEKNPIGAVRNNIRGSWQLANIALRHNVGRFVLISTDKAVNPINVMGASKRVCELICQYLQMKTTTLNKQTKKTKFLAVRFGNVLGSSGSVVQRFKEQIEQAGPVTVTHPDIRRYFMSISEACQLVMQAGAIGNGGEIFILDMEEPIRIMKLAEQMITLAGYRPHEDIKVVLTGLRPGEKIYEELLTDVEASMATTYPGVRIAKMTAAPHDLEKKLNHVFHLSQDSDANTVKEALKNLVPEFQVDTNDLSWKKNNLRIVGK